MLQRKIWMRDIRFRDQKKIGKGLKIFTSKVKKEVLQWNFSG